MNFKLSILIFTLLIFSSCDNKKEMTATVDSKNGINIRTEPNTNSEKISFIPDKTKIIVLNIDGPEETLYGIKQNWYKIKYNEKIGWAFGGLIKINSIQNIYKLDEIIPIEKNNFRCPNVHSYEINHNNFKLKLDGLGSIIASDDVKNLIKIFDESCVERIFYANYKEDIILLFELDNYGGGCSRLIRINTYGHLRKIYDIQFGGFSLSNGLIENHYIYLSTIGFIGKVDLDTGIFIWKQEDLYKKYLFNDFSDITLENEKVYFFEGENPPKNSKRRKIEVNKNTGELHIVN